MPPADTAADKPDRVAEAAAAYESAPGQYDPAIAGVRARRQLEDAKFERKQADAVVLAVRELAGDLASKTDLTVAVDRLDVALDAKATKEGVAELRAVLETKSTKSDIARLDGEIATLRSGEIATIQNTMATKEDIVELRAILDTKASTESVAELRAILDTKASKADIADMATKSDLAEVKAGIEGAEKRIIVWLFGAILAAAGLLATVSGLF